MTASVLFEHFQFLYGLAQQTLGKPPDLDEAALGILVMTGMFLEFYKDVTGKPLAVMTMQAEADAWMRSQDLKKIYVENLQLRNTHHQQIQAMVNVSHTPTEQRS